MSKLVPLILLSLFSFISACNQTDKQNVSPKNPKPDSVSSNLTDETYICRFHPFERKNGPGYCSVCGAEMISLISYNNEMTRKNEEMKKKWKSYIGSAYLVIDLPSVKCNDCEPIIVQSLMKNKGILDFQVDIINKDVFLFYDPFKTKKEDIEQLLTQAGFDTKDKKGIPEAAHNLPDCCR
jgi:hypothetical protein